ncbi:MAG: FAD-binding oxidoreductase [Woeseiaceae bacterium]|nr:FAD-binding oxidoreductase [Woeseiaceae bacterium]
MAELQKSANVVVIGGGVIGCSIAYHLAKLGISDVVLLERQQLTCGTTWHAAGLVGQLRSSINMTKLAKYTSELYRGLEYETGQATGYRQSGSISIASTAERFEEFKRAASMAKVFDLEVNVMSVSEIAENYPLIHTDDLYGGIHIPSDGYANAIDITQALAKGARNFGAQIIQDTKVLRILHDGKKVTGVNTPKGDIKAQHVVICGGMWSGIWPLLSVSMYHYTPANIITCYSRVLKVCTRIYRYYAITISAPIISMMPANCCRCV